MHSFAQLLAYVRVVVERWNDDADVSEEEGDLHIHLKKSGVDAMITFFCDF
jgi:hypothetical protein